MAFVTTSLQQSILILIALFTNMTNVLGSTEMKAASRNHDLRDNDNSDNHVMSYCAEYSSCAQRCSQALIKNKFRNPLHICSCDYLCLLYNDCCFDFKTQCPIEYEKFNQSPLKRLINIKAKCIGPNMVLTSCVDGNLETSSKLKAKCTTSKYPLTVDWKEVNTNSSDMTSSIKNNENCEEDADDMSYVLVTDLQTGLTYKDTYLYHCNNPGPRNDSSQTWDKKYESRDPFTVEELERFLSTGNSSERFLKALINEHPGSTVPFRYCPPEIKVKCNFDCKYNDEKDIKNFYRICEVLSRRRKPELKNHIILQTVMSTLKVKVDTTVKSWNLDNDRECYFSQPYGPFDWLSSPNAFSALLSLDSSTKGVIKNSKSQDFPGGWDKYDCETERNGSGCIMKFACDKRSIYFRNDCVKLKAILIIIKSTNHDSGHKITRDVWYRFMKSLRNLKTFGYDKKQHDDVYNDHRLIHVYITLPRLLGQLARKDRYSLNRYKDIIETMFSNIVESDQWNGTVTTCFAVHPYGTVPSLKDLLSQFVDLKSKHQLFCEDITILRSWSKQRIGLKEGNNAYAQTWITSDSLRLYFAVFVVVYAFA